MSSSIGYADASARDESSGQSYTTTVPTSSVNTTLILNAAPTTLTTRYGFSGSGDTADFVTDTSNQVQQRHVTLPGGVLLTLGTASYLHTWSYPNIHGDIAVIAGWTGQKSDDTITYDPYGQPSGTLHNNSSGSYDYGWLGQHQRGTETNSSTTSSFGRRAIGAMWRSTAHQPSRKR